MGTDVGADVRFLVRPYWRIMTTGLDSTLPLV